MFKAAQGLPRHIFFDEDHPRIWIIQGLNSWSSVILVDKWTWCFNKTWDLVRKIWTTRFSVFFLFEHIVGFEKPNLLINSSHRIHGTCNFYLHENHKNQRHIYPRRSSWPFYRDFAWTCPKYQNLPKHLWIPTTHGKMKEFYTPQNMGYKCYNPQKCRFWGSHG